MVIAPCAAPGDGLTHRVRGHTDSFNFKLSKQVPVHYVQQLPELAPVVHSLDRQWGWRKNEMWSLLLACLQETADMTASSAMTYPVIEPGSVPGQTW